MRKRLVAIGSGVFLICVGALVIIAARKQSHRRDLSNAMQSPSSRSSVAQAPTSQPRADEIAIRQWVKNDLEELDHKAALSNPGVFASTGRHHAIVYAEVVSAFGPGDVPRMCALLENSWHKRDWRFIAQMIGFVSEPGSQKSLEALVGYLRRVDAWPEVKDNRVASFDVGMGKIRCLEWMGMIGGGQAEELLIKATTLEGAEELTKEWIHFTDVSYPGGRASALASVRGRAAMGLVNSRSARGNQLVEQMYVEEKARCIEKGVKTSRLFGELVSAMAYKAFIAEKGLQKRYELYGNERSLEEIAPYIHRYWLQSTRD